MHSPASIKLARPLPDLLPDAAPTMTRRPPMAPTMKPISPMRRAVPAPRARKNPMTLKVAPPGAGGKEARRVLRSSPPPRRAHFGQFGRQPSYSPHNHAGPLRVLRRGVGCLPPALRQQAPPGPGAGSGGGGWACHWGGSHRCTCQHDGIEQPLTVRKWTTNRALLLRAASCLCQRQGNPKSHTYDLIAAQLWDI
jgi:hypothetical protein